MTPPTFFEALGFSLLSLCVNPALCLQSIFSLSTCGNLCPIYVGFRPTVFASNFCSPHPTNKTLKKSLDFSSFLGFNFDNKSMEFQMHSCRGNIVEMNTYRYIRALRAPPEKKVENQGPPAPPPPSGNTTYGAAKSFRACKVGWCIRSVHFCRRPIK